MTTTRPSSWLRAIAATSLPCRDWRIATRHSPSSVVGPPARDCAVVDLEVEYARLGGRERDMRCGERDEDGTQEMSRVPPLISRPRLDSLVARCAVTMSTNPIAISSAGGGAPNSTSLPAPLQELVQLRIKADSALHSPALEHELAEGIQGPQVAIARDALREVIALGKDWQTKAATKLSRDHQARGEFCLAWALGRIGEYDGTEPIDLPNGLSEALERYQAAADLLDIPPPPLLDRVPSVTRPGDAKRQSGLDLAEVPAFAGEMLAEWARTQTTLAFSSLLTNGGETVIDEDKLADLLEMACRRNVQGERRDSATKEVPLPRD